VQQFHLPAKPNSGFSTNLHDIANYMISFYNLYFLLAKNLLWGDNPALEETPKCARYPQS
jgi:hypothetical protein